MKGIDHSFLLSYEESYVPFIAWGSGIRIDHSFYRTDGCIVDIAATIAYLLGIPYPNQCRGRVLAEIVDGLDRKLELANAVTIFNEVYFQALKDKYLDFYFHTKGGRKIISSGISKVIRSHEFKENTVSILSFGSGPEDVIEEVGVDRNRIKAVYLCDPIFIEPTVKTDGETKIHSVSSLDMIERNGIQFDIIFAHSILHHIYDPRTVTKRLAALLKSGGIIVGTGEPNKEFLTKYINKQLATLAKKAGFNVPFPPKRTQREIIARLDSLGYKVCDFWDVVKIVEFHSPLE
jgi:SAM-dependent methyltransferase